VGSVPWAKRLRGIFRPHRAGECDQGLFCVSESGYGGYCNEPVVDVEVQGNAPKGPVPRVMVTTPTDPFADHHDTAVRGSKFGPSGSDRAKMEKSSREMGFVSIF
jgi:hypothetical protein